MEIGLLQREREREIGLGRKKERERDKVSNRRKEMVVFTSPTLLVWARNDGCYI